MFLYDSPNIDRVTSYPSIMNHHGIDCIKLLKGGEKSDIPFYKYDGLKEISNTSRWSFAIQPTIWNTKSYLKLCENISNQSIWEFERNGQQVFKDLHMRALYTYRGEPKRGKHHWDSSVFPYIATAIGKGKWNFGEYKKELTVILEEYNIDYAIRGIF